MDNKATENRQKSDFWRVLGAPGDPWDGSRGPLGLQGPELSQKGPFFGAQDGSKIDSRANDKSIDFRDQF